MSVVARWREAADWMLIDPDPAWTPVAAMLTEAAYDAAKREPHQDRDLHAVYLATGARRHATGIATAYLTRTGLVRA